MAETKEYAGIARGTLDCLRQHLESHGLTSPSGDSGIIKQQGVILSVTYIEAQQILQFGIIERPLFIPEDLVWSLLDQAVKGCAEN
jgi:hypothetical protein